EIEKWTRERSPDEAVAAMQAADVPVSKICTIRDIVADAQYSAREMIRHVELDDGSKLAVPAVVPKLSRTPGHFDGGGPRLGEHTDQVLRDLGYDAETIADLQTRGIVT
ncbi:MAG TPA: CoA transferase, partial [Casimicrobiaceae bacterium]|nr:CoA transferase [Casimicrobiaceae bacterium]